MKDVDNKCFCFDCQNIASIWLGIPYFWSDSKAIPQIIHWFFVCSNCSEKRWPHYIDDKILQDEPPSGLIFIGNLHTQILDSDFPADELIGLPEFDSQFTRKYNGYWPIFKPNPYWREQGFNCQYEHCIENMPFKSNNPKDCPIFGHECPSRDLNLIQACGKLYKSIFTPSDGNTDFLEETGTDPLREEAVDNYKENDLSLVIGAIIKTLIGDITVYFIYDDEIPKSTRYVQKFISLVLQRHFEDVLFELVTSDIDFKYIAGSILLLFKNNIIGLVIEGDPIVLKIRYDTKIEKIKLVDNFGNFVYE
ncbi:MAG: hypothetical protein ACTSP4_04750 [Candidatus Hodarchaeales archaeon]